MKEPEDARDKLKKLIDQVEDLPTLPSVVPRLISLVEKSDTTAADLNAVITQDPALTAKVLKLVNSAFYGFSRQITTVSEAVVILGFNAIKSLALSASVFEVLSGEGSPRFDRVGIWKHSVATGVAAETAAKWVRFPNPEEVMVAGILHNIGKIVLDIYFSEELAEILDYIEENDCTMLEAEKRVLGVGHPRIGGWLASHWNLPASLEAGITYYRDPFQADEEVRRLPCLIHVGDVLARTKNVGWAGDEKTPDYREEVWKELEVEKEDIEVMLEQLERNLDKAEAFMKLATNQGRIDGDG